jgi:hypothetical protein
VPIGAVAIEADVARPGRRVQMVEAELSVEGQARMRVRGWRLQKADLDLPETAIVADPPPPPPSEASGGGFFPTGQEHGYHTGMEARFVSGGFNQAGPASVWLRMRQPLVAGEPTSPLARVLVAADSGNGVSAALDYRRHLFINTELTVHLVREPAGEWVHLDARTYVGPHGVGLSESVLHDETGRLGRAAQTLLVRRRS